MQTKSPLFAFLISDNVLVRWDSAKVEGHTTPWHPERRVAAFRPLVFLTVGMGDNDMHVPGHTSQEPLIGSFF